MVVQKQRDIKGKVWYIEMHCRDRKMQHIYLFFVGRAKVFDNRHCRLPSRSQLIRFEFKESPVTFEYGQRYERNVMF